ncbi:hypothetical protein PM082_021202 [Marasmius tenuissimus]|nr:hypothetical protein PM082_021202 [Marasmius tenuissimus]
MILFKASDLLNDLRRKLEVLNQKILQLESDTEKARLGRINTQHTLNTLLNSNTPWAKLPNEMFVKIFQHCVDADTGGHILSGRAVPWVLAQICCRWRAIVVSTPSLWNMIRVNTKYMCHDPLQVVKTWIERSQHLPLSCMVLFNDMNTTRSDQCETDETAIFDILLDSCGSWGHLYVRFGVRVDLCSKLLSNHCFIPHLRSIRIFTYLPSPRLYIGMPPELYFFEDQPQIFGLTAPKLTDASINALFPLESIALPLPLPPTWRQVQTL